MRKVNFNAIKEHVSTQYGDLTGVIQIDGHSNISCIYDLCSDHGFDTEGIFIIGFGLGESTTNGVGRNDQVHCSVLYVNKDEYGSDFDEIQTTISKDDVLKLKRKNIYIKYSNLGKYIKRFEFIATTRVSEFASTIEIEDVEE
jgi:hypothetical protein